jgi:protein ImuA
MKQLKRDIISRLQKDILLRQGFNPRAAGVASVVGLGQVEAAFPNAVFPVGAIHEFITSDREQAAASIGFMAGLISGLAKKGGACLWISVSGKLFPPSLTAFDVEPDRMIFIDVEREKDVLWAMEEALKCEGLAAVIAEVRDISFAQSRRLQLAVESSKVTGLLLRNDPRRLGTTTCVARWQITPLPSEPEDELPGVGFPRWQVDLLRVRNGSPGSWKMEWVDGCFVPVDEKMERMSLPERQIA